MNVNGGGVGLGADRYSAFVKVTLYHRVLGLRGQRCTSIEMKEMSVLVPTEAGLSVRELYPPILGRMEIIKFTSAERALSRSINHRLGAPNTRHRYFMLSA